MNIRAMEQCDINQLKEIHTRYFSDEFDFPDFMTGYHCAFIVEDSNRIIVGGGVRPIAESVIITNKVIDTKSKREALNKILDASEFVCHKFRYTQLHAFVQDERWRRHLLKIGFEPTVGQSLVINI